VKSINLILVVNLFLFLSCNSKKTDTFQDDSPNDKQDCNNRESINIEKPVKDLPKIELINDEFVRRVLEKDLLLENLKAIYQPTEITKQTLKNTHDSHAMDTILIFTKYGDSIQYYKGSGNLFPQKIVIHSDKILIDNSIRIGANKEVFNQKFNIKLVSNILIVRDTEEGSVYLFVFKDNLLTKIIYESSYVD